MRNACSERKPRSLTAARTCSRISAEGYRKFREMALFALCARQFFLYFRRRCLDAYNQGAKHLMPPKKVSRRCLEQLAATPPKRKAALIRSLLPGIEAALTSGQTLKDIWEALETEGLKVSYHTFNMALEGAKRKQTAPSGSGKQQKSYEHTELRE